MASIITELTRYNEERRYFVKLHVAMCNVAKAENVLAIGQVKQGTETTRFRVNFTQH